MIVRNDDTSDNMKFLNIKSKSGQSEYICYENKEYCYHVRNNWMYEKRAQLWQ